MRGPRYAEEMFPMKEISEISAKEKSVRHGHISTLHIWWARRPLASSRAMNYAALVPMPEKLEEIQSKKDFIVKLSKWENSLNRTLLERAKKDILNANDGSCPKVLDPFAGGGSIPLEALRLGCETYASDYNPVATLILKCVLEYPHEYVTRSAVGEHRLVVEGINHLSEDIKKWALWVLDKTKEEICKFYHGNKAGNVAVGYIWARTIPCQNPLCKAEIPLMRQYWLAKRNSKNVSLYPYVHNKKVKFRLVGNGLEKIPKGFDPNKGTISQAIATCPVCGFVTDDNTMRLLFSQHKSSERMVVVVYNDKKSKSKQYRLADENDMKVFEDAEKELKKKQKLLMDQWGFDPIPDEPIHTPDGKEYERGNLLYNFTPVVLYGKTKWRDLFNPRQKLALITLVDKVRRSYHKMVSEGYDKHYAKVITTYLALMIDRQADYNSSLCAWAGAGEFVRGTFGRQALPMVWDYFELCPWSEATGDWNSALGWVIRVIEHLSSINFSSRVVVTQFSATSLPYEDGFFDAVLTDPPYYDNVPYAVLSDFFYVWLKRSIGELYPDLFSTPLAVKSQEVIAELPLLRGMSKEKAIGVVPNIKTSKHFEDLMLRSFKEIYRVLKSNGIAVIVYAHKSTAGWETLINSLLASGLVVTAAWPINTERGARFRAKESAALASSIYMVAGKYKRTEIGFYRNIRKDLKTHLNNELDKLWNEGVSGADFLVAAIGSAIEVFGMYEKIIDDEGNDIRADKLLEQIRRIVTDYAVRQVLHNGFASEISQMTRLYLLWRWAYGEAKIQFDDARKLAQSIGLDLSDSWNKGFIQKDKEFIRILGPQDRNVEELVDSNELIDILHRVLLLWNSGMADKVLDALQQSGLGKNDTFYRIAQAISESLPVDSKEKKWLEGFLAGKARISKEIKVESGQRRLIE